MYSSEQQFSENSSTNFAWSNGNVPYSADQTKLNQHHVCRPVSILTNNFRLRYS